MAAGGTACRTAHAGYSQLPKAPIRQVTPVRLNLVVAVYNIAMLAAMLAAIIAAALAAIRARRGPKGTHPWK